MTRAAPTALPLFCRFPAVYVPVWVAVLDENISRQEVSVCTIIATP